MKKCLLLILSFAALMGGVLRAQDLTGNWQGTLKAGKDLRIIVKVEKGDDGKLKGKMYSIDQTPNPFPSSGFTFAGGEMKFLIPMIDGSYTGKLSSDGKTINGTWTQGGNPLPLVLTLATKETAWEIPAPPPPQKLMPADADPSFEVATIKPNETANAMQALFVNGRNFGTRGSSLLDLICFAYDVQAKQVVGAPDWVEKDRFDIAAVPDVDGAPSPRQLKLMIKKLVTERWQLKFHNDKRELSAFVLTVSKTGSKITPTTMQGPLPGIGMRPSPDGLTIPFRNVSIPDVTGFLQSLVLDRPVVDKTGLTGRYDFSIKFTPDDSLFNGHAPPIPKAPEGTEMAPGFYDAIQQQDGLKLTPEKTMVDVIAIDHVEKPSQN